MQQSSGITMAAVSHKDALASSAGGSISLSSLVLSLTAFSCDDAVAPENPENR